MKQIFKLMVMMLLIQGTAIAGEAYETQFNKIDGNGDGGISRQEFVESKAYKVDRKKVIKFFPGFKEFSKMQEEKYRSRLFDAIDSNKDGRLNKHEWKQVAPNIFEFKF